MSLTTNVQQVHVNGHDFDIATPYMKEVRAGFEENEDDFPFWAKIWPASVAMAEFLTKNIFYIRNKKVLEVAAGLGLPSIIASCYAEKVYCTDYVQQPLNYVNESLLINDIKNVDTRILNWRNAVENMEVDTILLSDINYDPQEFKHLDGFIQYWMRLHKTMILSTPHRIIATPFLNSQAHWFVDQFNIDVHDQGETTPVSIFVLEAK